MIEHLSFNIFINDIEFLFDSVLTGDLNVKSDKDVFSFLENILTHSLVDVFQILSTLT